MHYRQRAQFPCRLEAKLHRDSRGLVVDAYHFFLTTSTLTQQLDKLIDQCAPQAYQTAVEPARYIGFTGS